MNERDRIEHLMDIYKLTPSQFADRTGIHTMTAEDPMTAVAIGTGKYVEFLGGYRD